jgi:hypothetical protein
MLIDRYLPVCDASAVQQVEVNAPPEATYAALWSTDLRDPVIDALFAVRELPDRVVQRLRGASPPRHRGPVSFADITSTVGGWVILGEDPGVELVIGAVGRFWHRDYGWRTVSADEFTGFTEPGYAKLAISLRVNPRGDGSRLRYEARTATTDLTAHRWFRRYWRVIWPGVVIVMRRALHRIKAEAERERIPERSLPMIEKTREDLLTAMHTEAFGYARHMLFARLARSNGHAELADLLEDIAQTDYLEPFAEEARLVGLVGTDVENLEAVKNEASAPSRRTALRAALARLQPEPAPPEAPVCACATAGLPEADQDEAC